MMSWEALAALVFCALAVSGDRSTHIVPLPPQDICTSEGIQKSALNPLPNRGLKH